MPHKAARTDKGCQVTAGTTTMDDAGESEIDVKEALRPIVKKKVFKPFKKPAGPITLEAIIDIDESTVADAVRGSSVEEEMSRLCVEVTRLQKCEEELMEVCMENMTLKEKNALLLASQECHHAFTLDTCQHAHSQHMELLNISNKFYEWAKEWSNTEKDMTKFVSAEERKFEQIVVDSSSPGFLHASRAFHCSFRILVILHMSMLIHVFAFAEGLCVLSPIQSMSTGSIVPG
jgi:hypothetical protein